MTHSSRKHILTVAMGLAIGLAFAPTSSSAQGAGRPPAMVTTMQIKPETVTISEELPGRVSAFRTAAIRPQVGGILEERLFEQGADVKENQPLFKIASETYEAQVDNARAALTSAEASLDLANIQLDRARQLFEKKSASQQTYDSAQAEAKSAEASVAAAKATLKAQQINLDHTTVRSPINGRIGAALVSEGALVSANQAQALATVQQVDKVYVDLRRSALDLLKMQKMANLAPDSSSIEILGVDGTAYEQKGQPIFTDVTVDEATGDVTMRVLVENPNQDLLPGMFVRALVPRQIVENALLIPQQAIIRGVTGDARIVVVDDEGKAHFKNVVLGELVKRSYIVTEGLEPNETVIIRGQTRVTQDGAQVNATPAEQPKQ
ncbi:efflux RND transporter periplasmic adaptor subunit [uncultured Cohaesibacter sp.]|uniref:efflux RND transporter periplasmic adaptor subunit n=1 Tax=uncultured Cohaesibacter sp. TaxID=1002546 RepID=UPI002AABB681|nr:efflux RND transporter periplasmic adaptor subunit [uncultured Cohaesibacter sp.]